MRYFAKYQVQAGFKFSLDGVHNVPKTAAYVGLYSLNPAGLFYKQPPDPTSVHLNSNLNWERYELVNYIYLRRYRPL